MSNSPIIILGSGRSGTTWILDSLAEANHMTPIFEPLLPEAVRDAKPYANKYIGPSENLPQLKRLMDNILSAKIEQMWTNYRIRPDRLIPGIKTLHSFDEIKSLIYNYKKLYRHLKRFKKRTYGRVIVKLIRANLMAEWIANNCLSKNLFVIRHPAAVAFSKLMINPKSRAINWDYKPLLSKYMQDSSLRAIYAEPFKSLLDTNMSEIAGYTALWCIENVWPINTLNKNIRFVYYEMLASNPFEEWAKISNDLECKFVPSTDIFLKPSHEASKSLSNPISSSSRSFSWMNELSHDEKHQIQQILNIFKVKLYNVFNPFPVLD